MLFVVPVQDFTLPQNVRATTDAAEAIAGAQYAVHAVPVQHSRAFLSSIKDVLPKDVPIICVSKGLEVGTGCMMSEVIPSALGRRQPAVFLSGPSFAKEVSTGSQAGGERQAALETFEILLLATVVLPLLARG